MTELDVHLQCPLMGQLEVTGLTGPFGFWMEEQRRLCTSSAVQSDITKEALTASCDITKQTLGPCRAWENSIIVQEWIDQENKAQFEPCVVRPVPRLSAWTWQLSIMYTNFPRQGQVHKRALSCMRGHKSRWQGLASPLSPLSQQTQQETLMSCLFSKPGPGLSSLRQNHALYHKTYHFRFRWHAVVSIQVTPPPPKINK